MYRNIVAVIMLPLFILSSCATYKQQYVAFRPPEAFANKRVVAGVTVAGEAYADKDAASSAFGFDIRGAGLLPVQLVLDNKGGKTLELITDQTFLVDANGGYWVVVPNQVAAERVDKFTQGGAIMGGAGKGALIGAAAVGLLGAAIGIVSGKNVGSAIGKGAAIGAAGGAIIGGTKEGTANEKEYRIADDVRNKGLQGKTVPPEYLAQGFLFFPGEANSARELRLQYRELESGTIRNVVIEFK